MLVMVAVLSLLTGCKSSRGSVRRGGSGVSSPAGSFSLEDYAKTVKDPMAKALISEAQGWIGTRYQYGGDSKSGTDCSGLVMRVYGNVCGLKIPRSTREQVRYCTKVARNKMQPGDLVFFASGKSDDKVSHVGLYIGEGRMIHASSSRGVMVSGFDSGYWGDRYFTGARVDNAPRAFASASKGRKNVAPMPLPPSPSVAPPSQPVSPAPELPGLPEFPDIPELSVPGADGPEAMAEVAIDAAGAGLPPGAVSAAAPAASVAASSTSGSPSLSPPAPPSVPSLSTIDLLDLIINQKVDSIFTSQFAD